MRAACDNDLERMRQLFRLGCPTVNAQDKTGCTALYWASYEGHEHLVRELLAHGADAAIESAVGLNGRLAVVRLLSAEGSAEPSRLGPALRLKRGELAAFLRTHGGTS